MSSIKTRIRIALSLSERRIFITAVEIHNPSELDEIEIEMNECERKRECESGENCESGEGCEGCEGDERTALKKLDNVESI
ncbi:MAG: hypothetical protein IJ058_11115 [Lachnospiraceae bacterium]|nr:hypothetical protein [Lachnospiraceae bacterium]